MTDIPQATIDELRRLSALSMDPDTDIAEANNAACRLAEIVSEILPDIESAQANERRYQRLEQLAIVVGEYWWQIEIAMEYPGQPFDAAIDKLDAATGG